MPVACPGPEELSAYAGGAAEAPEAVDLGRARIEAHAAGCARCREDLAVLALLSAPESQEEAAAIGEVALRRGDAEKLLDAAVARARDPAVPPPAGSRTGAWKTSTSIPTPTLLSARRAFRRPIWRAVSGAAAAVALAAGVLLSVRAPAPEAALAEVQGATRLLEPALSGVPWAPYQPLRGARDEMAFDGALRTLLEARERGRPGAGRALAMLYLLRGGPGDAARTDQLLARAGGGPDADNDRGAVSFARGDAVAALDAFDRALERAPGHSAAAFNRALALERLGARDRAADAYDRATSDPHGPWAAEARGRAERLRSRPPEQSRATSARLAALYALFAAGTPAELDTAREQVARLPPGLGADLSRLAGSQAARTPAGLAAHAALWHRYVRLRETAMSGSLPASEALGFAREPAVATDPLLWAPALQLGGYVSRAKGAWRDAQRLDLEVLRGCEGSPCAIETQAIALDELAEAAGRDGDFIEAHRLQDRAEALLAGVDARKQLAELHGKRSALLREERRLDEAAQAAALALRELADDRVAGAHAQEARATALGHLADLAVALGQRHAAADLHEAALSLARAAGAADLQADTARALAGDELELGRAAAARRRLEEEMRAQQDAGRPSSVASLALRLSSLAARQGDPRGALAAAETGLEAAAKGSWGSTATRLHLARARALRALGRDDPARDELQRTVDEVARSARTVADPEAASALAASAEEAAAELALASARAGKPAEELLLPLDSLRAAALGARAAAPGWSQELPPDACIYALLPAEAWTLAVEVARGGGDWHLVEVGKARLAALLDAGDLAGAAARVLEPLGRRCRRDGELWLFAPAPLDRPEMAALPYGGAPLHSWAAVGIATTLSRALAPEPAAAPPSALLVRDAQVRGDPAGVATALPGAERERAALSRMLGGAPPEELSGSRATPEAVLRAAARTPLVHFAVHGFDTPSGGYLQLAGEAGRMAARDVAGASFPGARVVLAACDAAAPGARSLSWAFARSGALAVAATSGRAGDAAAASWADRFYAALARGERFARANQAALLAVPDVLVVVTK